MTQEKHIEEKVTERKIEINGDDVPAGTNNPQPEPVNPANTEQKDEHSTDSQQDVVEKNAEKENSDN